MPPSHRYAIVSDQTPALPVEEDFLTLAAASSQAARRTKAAGEHLAVHLLKVLNFPKRCRRLVAYKIRVGVIECPTTTSSYQVYDLH